MRYLGGKSALLEHILSAISHLPAIETVLDLFAGSGAVATHLKQHGFTVCANDALYFSYVLSRGTLGINQPPLFEMLSIPDPVTYLNNLRLEQTHFLLEDCFIYQNYAPNAHCSRMYFQPNNAIKIDIIRQQIELWHTEQLITGDEYFYLLAMLLNAVPGVANITGTFGAYLKFWDKRTYKPLILLRPTIIESKKNIRCCNCDFTEMLQCDADLLYADPPYNTRGYLANYHLLETIAKYDNPLIYGITGMRTYTKQKSVFCKKKSVAQGFDKLLRDTCAKYVLISYNTEGLLSTEELTALCQKYAVQNSFSLTEIEYRRYKNKIPNNKNGLKEQFYLLRRH